MSDLAKPLRPVVRLAQVVGLCPGLFQPLPKSSSRPALDIVFETKSSTDGRRLRVHVHAPEVLGTGEQTTLLALLGLTYERLLSRSDVAGLGPDEPDRIGQALWQALGVQAVAAPPLGLFRFTLTWAELCRAVGRSPGGPEIAMRQDHVRRLCSVQFWEYVDGQRAPRRQSMLISWALGDDSRVHLALNPALIQALLGTPYLSVSLAERLQLHGDTTLALHAALSAMVWPGHARQFHTCTLHDRLWLDGMDTVNASTARRRRADLERALQAIGDLSAWSVTRPVLGGAWHVKRKKLQASVRDTPSPRSITAGTSSDREQIGSGKALPVNDLAVADVSDIFSRN